MSIPIIHVLDVCSTYHPQTIAEVRQARHIADDLRPRIDLRSFALKHGFVGKSAEHAILGRCPWRPGRECFGVYCDEWIDFGAERCTDVHGDVFAYVERLGLVSSFYAAIGYVSRWMGCN